MPEDSKNISIGVTFAKIVDSITTAQVNEIIKLNLITGLTPDGIVWVKNDLEIKTNPDSTIVFKEPGIYRPKVLGFFLHESYNITVTE